MRTPLRRLAYVASGIAYGGFLWLFGSALTGAGHGTGVFAVLALAPLGFLHVSLLYVYWGFVGFLAADSSTSLQRYGLITSILLHYLAALVAIVQLEVSVSEMQRVISVAPLSGSCTVVWYVVGQCFLWVRAMKGFRHAVT